MGLFDRQPRDNNVKDTPRAAATYASKAEQKRWSLEATTPAYDPGIKLDTTAPPMVDSLLSLLSGHKHMTGEADFGATLLELERRRAAKPCFNDALERVSAECQAIMSKDN